MLELSDLVLEPILEMLIETGLSRLFEWIGLLVR